MRYIAHFHPQAWQDGHAVSVGGKGLCFFDVTEVIEAASPERRASLLEPDTHASDELRDHPNAPSWAKNWDGPFYVQVYQPSDVLPQHWTEMVASAEMTAKRRSKDADLLSEVASYFPDVDGHWGRGFRSGLEATMLAMQAAGVSEAVFTEVLTTVMDAYGNNVDKDGPGGLEIRESLVVSTAHLEQIERDALWGLLPVGGPDLGHLLSVGSGDYEATVFLPSEDEEGPAQPGELPKAFAAHAEKHFSKGFVSVLREAARNGCNYVVFDSDGPLLAGVEVYE